jgi:glycosyltransferase involved in cell wall biosynthesis
MDSTEPLISIIIPTFNRDKLLKYGLDSIATLNIPWEYEILVLDEFVLDTTEELCFNYKRVRYIKTRPTENANTIKWRAPGLAINYGVKQARGKIIILACPEIYHLDRNNMINLITPLLNSTRIVTHTQGFDDQYGNFLALLDSNTLIDTLPECRDLCTTYAFFLAMNKQDFIDVGGYDEDFQAGYCFDDTNFSKRLENAGCTFLKVEGAIVHLHHKRLRYNMPSVRELWEKNERLYISKIQDKVANVGREWGNL